MENSVTLDDCIRMLLMRDYYARLKEIEDGGEEELNKIAMKMELINDWMRGR